MKLLEEELKEKQNDCGIYYIKNITTNQIYIGQSKRLRERRNQHFSHLRKNKHENPHLQNSFNKYGESSFDYGVIQYCDEIDLDPLEIAYMNLFNVKQHGFNISDGGHDGGWRKDYAHIKLSSFNRHNKRMYALVYNGSIIRSSDKSFLEFLLNTYFDENGIMITGYCFDDLKKESKNNMRKNLNKHARIVKHGKRNNIQNYCLKYGNQFIKHSTDKTFLEFLLDKYFDKNKLLKIGASIEDIKQEKRSTC